jgi:hypothetical protein
LARHDFAAQAVSHELHAVTYSEDGNAKIEYAWVQLRSASFVHAGRSTGEHDAPWPAVLEFSGCYSVRKYLAVYMALPYAAGDQLAVLSAEIDYDYHLV